MLESIGGEVSNRRSPTTTAVGLCSTSRGRVGGPWSLGPRSSSPRPDARRSAERRKSGRAQLSAPAVMQTSTEVEAKMRTVTLTEPGLEGRYLVDGPDENGRLELRPEPTLTEVVDDMGARIQTKDEFERSHGHLPVDDEA